MGGLLNYDNKFFMAIDKILNVFYISVLWIIFCIPIFTIGASSTAMYYTVNKVLRHSRGYVFHEFWTAFKENFKQSTIIWLIFLAIGIIMGIDCWIMKQQLAAGQGYGKLYIFFAIMLVFEAIWGIYVFSYIARFQNNNKAILKNGALIAVANLPWTLLIVVILVAFLLVDYLFPFLIICIPAAFTLCVNLILERIFRKYMTEEDIAAEEEKNRDYMN